MIGLELIIGRLWWWLLVGLRHDVFLNIFMFLFVSWFFLNRWAVGISLFLASFILPAIFQLIFQLSDLSLGLL